MGTRKRDHDVRLNVILDEHDYRDVMSAVSAAKMKVRGSSMKAWVHQAIREKLGRPPAPDPLNKLTAVDRARVQRCVEVLAAGADGDFLAALDGLLALAIRVAEART